MKTEIQKLLKANALMLGTDVVMKGIKKGVIKKVFLAKNCNEVTVRELEDLKAISEFEIVQTDITNKELGLICRKPFSISVIGVR
ncbi:ribosomal L7Ae/L30e/S12e/Gadd45 family protein [Nanoarchaeota archaeon]